MVIGDDQPLRTRQKARAATDLTAPVNNPVPRLRIPQLLGREFQTLILQPTRINFHEPVRASTCHQAQKAGEAASKAASMSVRFSCAPV